MPSVSVYAVGSGRVSNVKCNEEELLSFADHLWSIPNFIHLFIFLSPLFLSSPKWAIHCYLTERSLFFVHLSGHTSKWAWCQIFSVKCVFLSTFKWIKNLLFSARDLSPPKSLCTHTQSQKVLCKFISIHDQHTERKIERERKLELQQQIVNVHEEVLCVSFTVVCISCVDGGDLYSIVFRLVCFAFIFLFTLVKGVLLALHRESDPNDVHLSLH